MFICRYRRFSRVFLTILSLAFLIGLFHILKTTTHEHKNVSESLLRGDATDAGSEGIGVGMRVMKGDDSDEEEEWNLENENIPNLSILLELNKGSPKYFSRSCAMFPNLYSVRFSNVHWQVQETMKETFYFYSAHLDLRGQEKRKRRKNNKSFGGQFSDLFSEQKKWDSDGAHVRVLAMADAMSLTVANVSLTTCQFWFENSQKPEFANITDCKMLWNYKWGRSGRYYPYLLTCPLPPRITEPPLSVSLVSDKCDHATNNLHISHRNRVNSSYSSIVSKKDFGVCVKALDFPDGDIMQYRLVEWIEMLRILGADKIFFYEFYVDPEIKKILNYYESKQIVDVRQTTLPGLLPNHPQLRHLYIRGKKTDKRLTELIPYNDCFYSHMYDYKYILVIDTDELIIPQEKMTWSALLKQIVKNDLPQTVKTFPISTFCFRNFYFLDGMLEGKEAEVEDIPLDFHMLRHIHRSTNSTGMKYMKCLHSTDLTLGVHNHFALFCRDERKCRRHYVLEKRAQMNHYRSACVSDLKNCTKYIRETERDEKIWRYKDELIARVNEVMREAFRDS